MRDSLGYIRHDRFAFTVRKPAGNGVSVVWLVMTVVYMKEARKLEKRR